jgi:hypothetical protein
MIFAAAQTEPVMFLLLTEKDVRDLRAGHTKFVDVTATGGLLFSKVIVSLHATNEEAIRLVEQYGFESGTPVREPQPLEGETRCSICRGIMKAEQLFEERCIVCWATAAKDQAS